MGSLMSTPYFEVKCNKCNNISTMHIINAGITGQLSVYTEPHYCVDFIEYIPLQSFI